LTRATGYDNCTIFNVNATGHIYIRFLSDRRQRAREDRGAYPAGSENDVRAPSGSATPAIRP